MVYENIVHFNYQDSVPDTLSKFYSPDGSIVLHMGRESSDKMPTFNNKWFQIRKLSFIKDKLYQRPKSSKILPRTRPAQGPQ